MAAVVVEGAGAGGKSSWRGVRNWRGPPSAHSHMCFECLRWCYDVISSQRQAAAPAVFEFSHSYETYMYPHAWYRALLDRLTNRNSERTPMCPWRGGLVDVVCVCAALSIPAVF